MLGYDVGQLRELVPNELLYPDTDGFLDFQDTLNTRSKARSDLIFIRKDGSRFSAAVSGAVFKDSQGQTLDVFSFDDISERKQTEAALRESEDKFSKVFHTSPSIMVISSLEDGRYLDVNKAFEEVMGYSCEQMRRRTSLEVGIWPDPRQRRQLAEQLKKEGRLRNIETVLQTKKRELKTVVFSAELITLQGAQYVLSAWLNITERKQAEEALRQLNETLEQQVVERTTVAEARSQQLQSLAVELIEAEERERSIRAMS